MTEFRILAERIAEDMDKPRFICNYFLDEERLDLNDYFIKYFKPNLSESKRYKLCAFSEKDNPPFLSSESLCDDRYYKLGEIKKRNLNNKDNQFRILILLFAEQHYLHYKKIDEK